MQESQKRYRREEACVLSMKIHDEGMQTIRKHLLNPPRVEKTSFLSQERNRVIYRTITCQAQPNKSLTELSCDSKQYRRPWFLEGGFDSFLPYIFLGLFIFPFHHHGIMHDQHPPSLLCLRYTLHYIISSIAHLYTYSQSQIIGHMAIVEFLYHTIFVQFFWASDALMGVTPAIVTLYLNPWRMSLLCMLYD